MKRLLTTLVLAAVAPLAAAQSYRFDCITSSSLANCAAGEAQLGVTVSSTVSSQALFTFLNSGALAMSLTDVYFQDGPLLGIASIVSGTGLSFSKNATPADLPGGNAVNFQTTQGFSADSNAPVPKNGVNPGETLGIVFNLLPGRSFSEVAGDLASGALRIGVHVQAFGNGGSESFVSIPSPVPEPSVAAYLLGGLGLLAVARRRGRR